jgi:predicted nucleotidyltransferase
MNQKNIKSKIKNYFFINPNSKLRVREIERELNIPLPSVIRYCNELTDENILSVLEIGNTRFYTSHKTGQHYKLEKKLFNIKQIYNSKLIDYLKEKLNNPSIVLFGSYMRGEDDENSDIDLFVETFSKNEIILDKFEKLLNRKLQLFKYGQLKDVKNKHLANNIINGIVLNGYIEVFE